MIDIKLRANSKIGDFMNRNRESFFTRIKKYNGNPIDEYNKIRQFLTMRCYFDNSIFCILSDDFQFSNLLRGYFINFEDCLMKTTQILEIHKNEIYQNLDACIKETLLEDFLSFCEIIIHLLFCTYNHSGKSFQNNVQFNKNAFVQLIEMIKISLKSMNYDIALINEETYEFIAYKSNEDAEIVADQSPESLKIAIFKYLHTIDSDIDEKEIRLHNIIDFLEPISSSSSAPPIIRKIREYFQLLRHPVTKKEDKNYEWYFNNKKEYLDAIFNMCIFLKEYDITQQNIKHFEKLKQNK